MTTRPTELDTQDSVVPAQPVAFEGPSHEEIATRAHERYQHRGAADGADLDDWLIAERELLLERSPRTSIE